MKTVTIPLEPPASIPGAGSSGPRFDATLFELCRNDDYPGLYRELVKRAIPSGVSAPDCDPTWCRHCGFQVVLTKPPHPDSNPGVSAPAAEPCVECGLIGQKACSEHSAANAQPGELPPTGGGK